MQAADSKTHTVVPLKRRNWRSYWVRTMVQWHWISSAICLVGMILFAVTGITLNHASQIESQPVVIQSDGQLPPSLLEELLSLSDGSSEVAIENAAPQAVPTAVSDWLLSELDLSVHSALAEWNTDEVYVSMARPGSDAWLAIDLSTGGVEAEQTWRGWVSYFNDLHKGRHTGVAWMWFLDIFSIATLIFCMTGLMLLIAHSKRRKMTWPLVGLGLIIPAFIALLLMH